MTDRSSTIERNTAETQITGNVRLDGSGSHQIKTGLGFFDHMLTALSRHSGISIDLTCEGDLEVDDHHTVEDCAIALGTALDKALGERRGIARFGSAFAPLDEALSRTVIDFSGRPTSIVNIQCEREMVGDVATENFKHFFQSFAVGARATIHVDVLRGDNDHHRVESAFKAFALALKQAIAETGSGEIPSTKGVL